MSTLFSHITMSPYGKEEECAQFTVTAVPEQFTMFDVMIVGDKYTFQCWLKSDSAGRITIQGTPVETTNEWVEHVVTFVADSPNITIDYNIAGVYYIYHPKLETGTVATDWTAAIEDIEESIKSAHDAADDAKNTAQSLFNKTELNIDVLRNIISTLVVDENGGSLMSQTSTGWTFSMAKTEGQLRELSELLNIANTDIYDTNVLIDRIQGSLDELGEMANYVQIKLDGNQPYIILGEEDSDFKVVITNTDIRFMEGSTVPAYISNQSLHIKKAVIEEELTQGGFVWTVRSNGNMGLVWKGVAE